MDLIELYRRWRFKRGYEFAANGLLNGSITLGQLGFNHSWIAWNVEYATAYVHGADAAYLYLKDRVGH